MTGNSNFRFEDVAVVSLAACEAPIAVTSAEFDERLTPFYAHTCMRTGLLESLAGIPERRQWPEDVSFLKAAAMAGEKALDGRGVDRSKIGLLVDTSSTTVARCISARDSTPTGSKRRSQMVFSR